MSLKSDHRFDCLPFYDWKDYPMNLADGSLLGVNAKFYNETFTNWAKTMCSTKTNISVIRLNDETIPTHEIITDEESAESQLARDTPEFCNTRAVFISQEHSFKPFSITETVFRKVLSYHNVPPIFLDNVLGVTAEPLVFEQGYANVFSHASIEGQPTFELIYQLKYPEKNARDQELKWSIRKTQVYHRICLSGKDSQSFSLVLNPKEESAAEQSLVEAARDWGQWKLMEMNPLRQDLLILSAYLDNWRGYLTELGELYHWHQTYISAVKFDDDDDFNETFNFKVMNKLRRLEEKIQSAPVILKTTRKLTDSLLKMNTTFVSKELYERAEYDRIQTALDRTRIRVQGYQESVDSMLGRVKGLIKFVADTLSLRNQSSAAASQKIAVNHQRIATNISDRVLDLTQDSVDDNAIVRLVTLVTLFYLPGSFVASLFGMNLFDFDSVTASIRIATDFWIYLVVTIPLTALTAAGWWLAAERQKKKKRSRSNSSKV